MILSGTASSIADSRPVASKQPGDPAAAFTAGVFSVNFRAGNTLECLEIVQYR
jgi:hypothetical protein